LRRLNRLVDLESCDSGTLLGFLDDCKKRWRPSTYGLNVILIRKALRHLGRSDLASIVDLPKKRSLTETVKLLTNEEVSKLIDSAPTVADRLLVTVLYESGARRGEVANLKIKSVQFDEYGAILTLTGKSGTRRRRVYASVPDLRNLLNNHPMKNDPEAPLFLNSKGTPLTRQNIYRRIKKLGQKILNKNIYPHMFRHSRATLDSRLFTDREMMKLFGWKRPDMVTVYSHLSMRDVEDKDLVLHGLKSKEDILKPIVHIQKCPKCFEENAPIAVYCVKCGGILSGASTKEEFKKYLETREFHEVLDEAIKRASAKGKK